MDMEGSTAAAAAGLPAAADINGRRPSVGMRNPKAGLIRRCSLEFRTYLEALTRHALLRHLLLPLASPVGQGRRALGKPRQD